MLNNGVLGKQTGYFSAALSRVTGEYIHTVDYYLATEKKEVLIHAITWMNLENFMLREEARHKSPHTI